MSTWFVKTGGVITGKAIPLYRLHVLRKGIYLEGKGLKLSRGRSCLAIVKKEFGWKGNREKILGMLNAEIDRREEDNAQA
tara:strand:- start:1216 stop:1455 length:240 start_codon:yes stop_codon:yes gene_type:complete